MGVSPIEMSQMFTRTQDISPIKQHEDAKPMLDQNAFQQQLEKQVEEHSRKVIDPNKSSNTKYDYDAKKKGNGEYSGDGGRQRRKNKDKENDIDGRVLLKGIGRFDAKI